MSVAPYGLVQMLADYGSWVGHPQAKNGVYILKALFKKKERKNMQHRPSNLKIFIMWPFV